MHTPAVQRTLHELAADTLGCVDLHTSLVTEGAYALRDEGSGTWMAVGFQLVGWRALGGGSVPGDWRGHI